MCVPVIVYKGQILTRDVINGSIQRDTNVFREPVSPLAVVDYYLQKQLSTR